MYCINFTLLINSFFKPKLSAQPSCTSWLIEVVDMSELNFDVGLTHHYRT